jgi:fructose-bisphosphate aldolase class I
MLTLRSFNQVLPISKELAPTFLSQANPTMKENAAMNLAELNKVAQAMVAPGRGILAADESSGTIKKRFDAIGVESTPDARRDYRELLFRSTEAMSKYISGVILYDETIRQNPKDGTPLVKLIKRAGSIPGIKVCGAVFHVAPIPGAQNPARE